MAECEAHQSLDPTSCLSDWAWASLSSVSTFPLWRQWLVLSWYLLNVEYLGLMSLMILSVSLSWAFLTVFVNVPCVNTRLEASRCLFEESLFDPLLLLFWWKEICADYLSSTSAPSPTPTRMEALWSQGLYFLVHCYILSAKYTLDDNRGQSTNICWMNR